MNLENHNLHQTMCGLRLSCAALRNAHWNWTRDFSAADNARYLISNRLYEGGVFAVPPLVRAGSSTAARAEGWRVGQENDDTAALLVASAEESQVQRALLYANPAKEFIAGPEPHDLLAALEKL